MFKNYEVYDLTHICSDIISFLTCTGTSFPDPQFMSNTFPLQINNSFFISSFPSAYKYQQVFSLARRQTKPFSRLPHNTSNFPPISLCSCSTRFIQRVVYYYVFFLTFLLRIVSAHSDLDSHHTSSLKLPLQRAPVIKLPYLITTFGLLTWLNSYSPSPIGSRSPI